jgi:hypothetical protein
MGELRTKPNTLSGSVGRGGKNLKEDILTVQRLLSASSLRNAGGTEFATAEMGQSTAKLGDAIEKFQRFHSLPVPDGRVDQGKSTWKKMVELAGSGSGQTEQPTPQAGQLLARIPGTPMWEDWGYTSLPLLSHDKVVETVWELTFGGGVLAQWPMSTRAYVCDKSLGTPHVGIGWPEGVTRPSAYLLYFHHSIGQETTSYASAAARFTKGIGDYLIGRMKGLDQIARSGKNVCLVVPEPTFGGQGVFDRNEKLVTQVLKEIDTDLTGESRELPPLLVASYSDGLERLNNFLTHCPNLRRQVRAVYDFDGMYVGTLANVSLSNWSQGGARVFRYVGNSSPGFLPKESQSAYLNRCINRAPKVIPLPKSRWVNHPHYPEFNTNSNWANKWWMHFYIPSCMLYHGLADTDGI